MGVPKGREIYPFRSMFVGRSCRSFVSVVRVGRSCRSCVSVVRVGHARRSGVQVERAGRACRLGLLVRSSVKLVGKLVVLLVCYGKLFR